MPSPAEHVPPSRREIVAARASERIEALRQTLLGIIPTGPLVLEIGCGHGHFLTSYAKSYPALSCLGIDISSDRIARARRKAKRLGQSRLHFLIASAEEVVAALPSQTTLKEIFILFPDPWPKRRHHKNRILQAEFLASLAQRSESGARLYFRTDYDPYLDAGTRIIADSPDWKISADPWPFETETVFQARAHSFQSLVAVRG